MKQVITIRGTEIIVNGRLLRIAEPHGDRYRFVDDPMSVISGLRGCGARVDLFTFSQRLPQAPPQWPYAVEWDNLAVLHVSTFDYWWTKQLDNKTRNMVRRAEKKGLLVREVPFDDELVKGIREIYNECAYRQRRRFPHYGKDVETVRREEATFLDSSIFIGAYVEEALVGFVKLVPDQTCTQAGLMNIISMVKHRDKAPQNALIAHAVRACAERGIQYLVYSKFDYGKRRNDSLRDFKKNNGFQRVDTPRYFVPLTPMGRAAFQLRLHHGVRELVPEVVADRLRDLRGLWYGRRHRSVTEAG